MDYREARAYMKKAECYGSRPGLDSVRELLARLGNPQNDFPVIQIAGTNGKGSVGAFLCSALQKAGIAFGRFCSPAVFCERETISFEGTMISEKDYGDCMEPVAQKAEQMAKEGLLHPTAFEMETALAYLYFSKAHAALAVVEAGMGGALDATNVTDRTVLSVITSISMDHMSFLGDRLEEIAKQKAGIIKPGGVAVTGFQDPRAEQVLRDCCTEAGAKLILADLKGLSEISPGLAGPFQLENAAIALESVRCLQTLGFSIDGQAIREGFEQVVWRGRMQKLGSRPDVWMDGAHNRDGVRRLKEAMISLYGFQKIHMVIGIFRDKETDVMCREMAELMASVHTVTPPGSRGLPAGQLAKTAARYCHQVCACHCVAEAVEKAVSRAGTEGIVLIFGSLSYLAEAEKAYENLKQV